MAPAPTGRAASGERGVGGGRALVPHPASFHLSHPTPFLVTVKCFPLPLPDPKTWGRNLSEAPTSAFTCPWSFGHRFR